MKLHAEEAMYLPVDPADSSKPTKSLPPGAVTLLEAPQRADIVIGVVSTGWSASWAGLMQSIALGMKSYFPQYSWLLVDANTGTRPDLTYPADLPNENLFTVPVPRFGVHQVTFPWHGVPAKNNGYRVILEVAAKTRATVCLIADPRQCGFEPSWIDALIGPGLHSRYDVVSPLYAGGARAGVMSSNLLSPMLRALFGRGPMQPLAGELSLSRRMVRRLLKRHDWDSSPARFAPELRVNFIALAEGYRVAESVVGPFKREPTRHRLATQAIAGQVIGAILSLMEQYELHWSSLPPSLELDHFGQSVPSGLSQTRRASWIPTNF